MKVAHAHAVAAGLMLVALLVQPAQLAGQTPQAPAERPRTRFHHVHINSVDPKASIELYNRLHSERAKFAGMDAVRTRNGWILFDKAKEAVPNGTTSAFWHVGWGSTNTKALYERLIALKTPFETPLTDMKRIVDPRQSWYAYVEGPGREQIELFAETGSDDFEHVHLRAAD